MLSSQGRACGALVELEEGEACEGRLNEGTRCKKGLICSGWELGEDGEYAATCLPVGGPGRSCLGANECLPEHRCAFADGTFQGAPGACTPGLLGLREPCLSGLDCASKYCLDRVCAQNPEEVGVCEGGT